MPPRRLRHRTAPSRARLIEIGIRENEQVADALMIAFGVIMGREFSNCYPQGVFSEENHSFQTGFLYGAHEGAPA